MGDGRREPRFFVTQRRFLSAACRWVFGVGKLRDVLHPRPSVTSPTSRAARAAKPFLVDAQAAEAWRSLSEHYANVPFHAVKRSGGSILISSPTKRRKAADQGVFPTLPDVRSNHTKRAAFLPNSGADPVHKPAKPQTRKKEKEGAESDALRPPPRRNHKAVSLSANPRAPLRRPPRLQVADQSLIIQMHDK